MLVCRRSLVLYGQFFKMFVKFFTLEIEKMGSFISLKNYTIIILVLLFLTSFEEVQAENSGDELIELSGTVNCVNPLNGELILVSIYNTSKEWGTMTNMAGEFKIKMGKDDTIIFFTSEHKDYYYYLKDKDEFRDHSIMIFMEPDAIWLETVEIIGSKSLYEFKREILNTMPGRDNITIDVPVISKYVKQIETGEGAINLLGPLTYLQKKFTKHYQLQKKIQKNYEQ